MNLIQKQADDFLAYNRHTSENYQEFIRETRSELFNYRKTAHRIEFVQKLKLELKKLYDNHLVRCNYKDDKYKCHENLFYENALFFLQEELEDLEQQITPNDFSLEERQTINIGLQQILEGINFLKTGQEVTYDDFKAEFEQLKDLYYLDKKTWSQLFAGKLTEMVAGGIVSETASKSIVDLVKTHYSQLFNS